MRVVPTGVGMWVNTLMAASVCRCNWTSYAAGLIPTPSMDYAYVPNIRRTHKHVDITRHCGLSYICGRYLYIIHIGQ